MAYDIGPRIGIEGEKEFRKAISDINNNMRTLDTEMKAVASQFDRNDKSQEAYTAKNEVLNKQIDKQKQKLEELQKGLSAASDKYGENDRVTQGWQQAVNKAIADLNNMERELDNNTRAMSEHGDETADATEKTNKFKGALGGLGKGLTSVGKTGAKVAAAGIAAVGAAAAGAAAGALKLAKDVGKTADDLHTLSAQTGISTEQLQEWDYAMRFIDVDMNTMTGSMAKLVKNMDNANKGAKDQVEAFKRLNVAYQDGNGNLRNSQTVFKELIDALGNVQNETERDAIAMRLFGRSAQELNPLITAGSDELERLSKEAHEVGAVMSEDALDAAQEFDDMMQTLEASTKGLAASLGVAVLPAVQSVVGEITKVVPQITSAIRTGDWSGAGEAVTQGLNNLLGKITDASPGLANMASTIIGSLANSIVTAIPQVLPPLIEASITLLNTIIDILIENGPLLITAGVEAVKTLIDGIVEALPNLIDAAIDIIMALSNSIIDNLPLLIDAAVEIVLALVDGILELLPQIIQVALELIVTLVQGLMDALPNLIDAVPEIVKTIVDIIVQNLPLLIDAAIEIILALITAIIENLPLLIDAAIEINMAVAEGIIKAIPEILATIPKIFSAMKDAFLEIDWAQLGKDIISGITSGIANTAKSLANSATEAAKGALNSTKKFLGINSPSKVMKDEVGMMIGVGMAEGIADSARQVDRAMQGLNNELEVNPSINNFGSERIPIYVDIPVELDGKTITRSTGKHQYNFNSRRSRALGVR